MSTANKAAKLLKSAVKGMTEPVFEKALATYTGNADIVHSSEITFNILSDSEIKGIKPYIKEFGLDKPENMIRFLIELHFASFESINDGIGSIKGVLLKTTISEIESARELVVFAENNPTEKEIQLSGCISKLSDAMINLKNKIEDYVKEVRTVDDRKGIAFFVRAKFDLKKVDNAIVLATAALQAYIEAIELLDLIAVKKGGLNVQNYNEKAKNFIKSLSENGSISLMAAYDKAEDNTYWNSDNLKRRAEGIGTIPKELSELFENNKDEDDNFDLENDVIF